MVERSLSFLDTLSSVILSWCYKEFFETEVLRGREPGWPWVCTSDKFLLRAFRRLLHWIGSVDYCGHMRNILDAIEFAVKNA